QAESGYKGSEFSAYPPNFRRKIFQGNFTAAGLTRYPHPLRESGCKGTAVFPNRKTFSTLFFNYFLSAMNTHLIINTLRMKKFFKQKHPLLIHLIIYIKAKNGPMREKQEKKAVNCEI
ncbi:MAG: hypothetical protein IKH69_08280, partial [Bacteroidaceae bacterium]|nr:hypothetical protein [Bacteroidaceae bacterium]